MIKRVVDWREAVSYVPAPQVPCRTKGCERTGVMGGCKNHTPAQGIGLVKCRLCGEPVANHDLMELCR